ncbi:unnamed protein product [Parnassius apollo]|uniref:(apollo) hypothetical protein n=1 Tax=Parnassius apollo TaxID=110799 RepID=A0A8S3X2X6_PARAO|nr:unnamed protein product [Parnassius apollo]
MAASITRGVRVHVKATYFDENDGQNTWSRKHFGDRFSPRQKLLSDKELFFFGILYAMTLQELPDRRFYWNTISDGIFPPENFGQRFVMSRQRFEIILVALRFTQPSDLDDSDKSRNTRTLVMMVNDKLKDTIRPGAKITVDESMFA